MRKNTRSKDKRSTKKQIQEDLDYQEILINKDKIDQERVADIINGISIKKDIKFKNKKQKDLAKAIIENDVVFVSGAAGTGKTFIALKTAIEILKKPEFNISKILLTKPVVEAGESVGFLPGDLSAKIDPYMQSFRDNISRLAGSHAMTDMVKNEIVQDNPLPYMRGGTFYNSIAIIDEAQNTTISGLKLFISRLGEDSKLVIIGDPKQTDLKLRDHAKHGLEDAFERFQGIDKVAFIEFTEDEIVRHPLLIQLMKRYNKD